MFTEYSNGDYIYSESLGELSGSKSFRKKIAKMQEKIKAGAKVKAVQREQQAEEKRLIELEKELDRELRMPIKRKAVKTPIWMYIVGGGISLGVLFILYKNL